LTPSPALKKADVGVAMGVRGSEVAKDAGSIILMDDEFLSIVVGIEQGRVIFDNLIKVVAYTLSHLMPELFGVLIALLFDSPFGMTSLMILLIDLITEMPPALALAYETSEESIMKRPPRNLQVDRLVSKTMLVYAYLFAGIVETFSCLVAWIGVFLHFGVRLDDIFFSDYFKDDAPAYVTSDGNTISPERQLEIVAIAQSAYFCTLVLSQFWHAWMCKTRVVSIWKHGLFSNKYLNIGVVITLLVMLLAVLVPGVQDVLGSRFDASATWLYFVPSLISFALFWSLNELRKYSMRVYPDAFLTKYVAF
jgi:sodium/potassium-transporting ATPase subunit alpha